MKHVLFIFLLFLQLHVKSQTNNYMASDSIEGYKITLLFPFIAHEGYLFGYDTIATKIYYYKDQTLLHVRHNPIYKTSKDYSLPKDYWYSHFVLQENKKQVLQIDSYEPDIIKKPKREDVEHFFWFFIIDDIGETILPVSKVVPVWESMDSVTKNRTAFYQLEKLTDSNFKATLKIDYDHFLTGGKYKLSPALEREKGLAVGRIRLFTFSRMLQKWCIDAVYQGWDVERITNINPSDIMPYFEKARKEIKD